MSRGNRRQIIYLDEVDRQDFLKTLAEAGQKTGWQAKAERIIGEELRRLRWQEAHSASRRKRDPDKLAQPRAYARRPRSRSSRLPLAFTWVHQAARASAS